MPCEYMCSLLIEKSLKYKENVDEISIEGKELPAGNYVLLIRYLGTMSEDAKGLYLAYPKKTLFASIKSSVKKAHLMTEFEPSFARMVFPCFDEPDFKATFQLNVFVDDPNKSVVSNTPVKRIFQ